MRPILYLILTILALVTIVIITGPNSTSPAEIIVALGALYTVFTLHYQMHRRQEKKKYHHMKYQLIPNTLVPIQNDLDLYLQVLEKRSIIDNYNPLKPILHEMIPGAENDMTMRICYDDVKRHHFQDLIKKWESFWLSYRQLCDDSQTVIYLFRNELDTKIDSIKKSLNNQFMDLQNPRMDLLAGYIFSCLWEGTSPNLRVREVNIAHGVYCLVGGDIRDTEFAKGLTHVIYDIKNYAETMSKQPSGDFDLIAKKRDDLRNSARTLMITIKQIIFYEHLCGNCEMTR